MKYKVYLVHEKGFDREKEFNLNVILRFGIGNSLFPPGDQTFPRKQFIRDIFTFLIR